RAEVRNSFGFAEGSPSADKSRYRKQGNPLTGNCVNQELGFGRPRSVVRFPRGSNVWHHQHDENEPKNAPILGRVERKSVGALAKIVEHFKCRFCGRKRLRTSRIRKTRLRF